MKKMAITSILFASLLLLGSCSQQGKAPSNEGITIPNDNITDTSKIDKSKSVPYIINITKDGFSPSNLNINVGDTVNFLNTDDSSHWPASDTHPTNAQYPGSGVEKCGTADQSNIFDACKGLIKNEIFSFTFKEKGTWKYHDHLDSTKFGSITVK
ncbi:MAG: hypothetical protein PHS92_05490 [Candidatus Gracilibacteria bacterium]|nr:hypothetical protein [Candidatus Gracilibacteria bacterium]